jgi:hypothetical protein
MPAPKLDPTALSAMKTLLTLIASVATLSLSACDTFGLKNRHNNTGPGGSAGPDLVWGPRRESSLSVLERKNLEAARRAKRAMPAPTPTAPTPVGG